MCEHCVYRARNKIGICPVCGHEGVLPGFDDELRPICRSCSGISLNVDCLRCGYEGWLPVGGLCPRCLLSDRVDDLLRSRDGTTLPPLQPMAAAIKTMEHANSGVTWLRNPVVSGLLRRLSTGEVTLSHEALDALPASRTVQHIRGLLVEHGALPARDEYLATFSRWLHTKLAAIEDPHQRQLVETFATWHHVRNLRAKAQRGAVTPNAFLQAKQSTTLAVEFLTWLKGRGSSVATWTQHDIDAWFGSGPSTRWLAQTFIKWAMRTRRARPLSIPSRQVRTHPKIGQAQRLEALRMLLLDDDIALPWRIGGILVLLYGQPAERIARLEIERVSVDDENVRLRLAEDWLDVPEPFATLLRAHVASRPNMQTAGHASSRWLFPGGMPGRPINQDALVQRLREFGVPVRAAKTGTWQQLVREGPPTVLAQALGISPVTAMRHAQRAGTDWLRYAGLRQAGDTVPPLEARARN